MFFDRDENARREREIAYRNQLKGQIELKNSKIYQNQERSSSNKPQTFSLLKNIQVQEQNRKKRQQNFYSDLQRQIQFQKQQKRRKKQEQARRELQEQQRIKKDHQMLRQRAQMQKQQQQKKKGQPKQQTNNDELDNYPQNTKSKRSTTIQQNNQTTGKSYQQPQQNNYRQQNTNQQNNYYSRLKTTQSQPDQNQLPLQTFQPTNERRPPYTLSSMPTYVNRVQNEPFNFLPQRKYMDSYFQELLGQKRRFQQEAASISELNRILYQEKSRAGKIQSRGLGQLKKLQNMLDQKGSNYMATISNSRSSNEFDSLRKLTVPAFQNSRVSANNSGWRKLD